MLKRDGTRKQFLESAIEEVDRVQNADELADLIQEIGLGHIFTSKQKLIEFLKAELEEGD